MDGMKIGKFISQRRKILGLTQKQMADELGVSDKTVSKWENGASLPDITLLQKVCGILEIDLNELLSGEKLNPEDYMKKADENLSDLVKNMDEHKKTKKAENIGIMVGIFLIFASFIGMIFAVGGRNQLLYYVDFRTAFFLLGVYILTLAVSGKMKDYLEVYRIVFHADEYSGEEIGRAVRCMKNACRLLFIMGLGVSLVAVVTVFGWLPDVSKMGEPLSQAVLSVFYMLILECVQAFCIFRLEK